MNTAVWTPKHPQKTRMWEFMHFLDKLHGLNLLDYHQLYQWSIEHPELFWPALCEYFSITFDTPAQEIITPHKELFEAHWFRGVHFNFAEQLLSRNDDHTAIISIDELGHRSVLSYKALRHQVALCAAGLKEAGVMPGDRVGAVMPNVAYTLIAMLATTSLGAIWSSCSPDFGAQTITDRLGQIEPKVLFICDGHSYQGKIHDAHDKIMELSNLLPTVKTIVVCPNIHNTVDVSRIPHTQTYDEFIRPGHELTFASLPFDHPVYILFSSGTTGKPKCIIHGAGGTFLQHLKELGLHTDLKSADNLCFYTTCGWMMWNWMASTLALGATLTLYEGSPSYPNAGRLFQLIDEEQITVLGTSAKFISTLEKEGMLPNQNYTLTSLRCILSTGSPLLPRHYDFVYEHIKEDLQLSSMSGGTDIISCFALGNPILPVYKGELQCIGLGMSAEVFDENGLSVRATRGELVCTKAFPSMPVGFWNDPERKKYHKAYFEHFPGVWAHGDFAEITDHEGMIIYGRSDSLLKPGGVRIGTAEIYQQVEKIPEVLDSVVIGQDWEDDVRIVLFVKLIEGETLTQDLIKRIQQTIKQNTSPRHVPAKILQVKDIPHTISGKVVEIAVRQTVQGQPIQNLQSIANPESLDDFKDREELKTH